MFSRKPFATLFFFVNFLSFYKLNSFYHDSINNGGKTSLVLTTKNTSNFHRSINSINRAMNFSDLASFHSQVQTSNSQINYQTKIFRDSEKKLFVLNYHEAFANTLNKSLGSLSKSFIENNFIKFNSPNFIKELINFDLNLVGTPLGDLISRLQSVHFNQDGLLTNARFGEFDAIELSNFLRYNLSAQEYEQIINSLAQNGVPHFDKIKNNQLDLNKHTAKTSLLFEKSLPKKILRNYNNKYLEAILDAAAINNFSQVYLLSNKYSSLGGMTLFHDLIAYEQARYIDDPYLARADLFQDFQNSQINKTLQVLSERKNLVNQIKSAYGFANNLSREDNQVLYNIIDLSNGDPLMINVRDPESLKNFQNKVKADLNQLFLKNPQYIANNSKLKRGIDLTKCFLMSDFKDAVELVNATNINSNNKNKDIVFEAQNALLAKFKAPEAVAKTADFLTKLNSSDLDFSKNLASKYYKFTSSEYLSSQDSSQAKFLNKEFCSTLDKISQACIDHNIPTTDLKIDAALKLNMLGFNYTEQEKFDKAFKVLNALDSLIDFSVGILKGIPNSVISNAKMAGKLAYNIMDIVAHEEIEHERLMGIGFAYGFNSPEYLTECQKYYDINKEQANKILASKKSLFNTGQILGKAILDYDQVRNIALMHGVDGPEFAQAVKQFDNQNQFFIESLKSLNLKAEGMTAQEWGEFIGEQLVVFMPYGKIGKILQPLLTESATALKQLGNIHFGKIEEAFEAVELLNAENKYAAFGVGLTDEIKVLSASFSEAEKALPVASDAVYKMEKAVEKYEKLSLSKNPDYAHSSIQRLELKASLKEVEKFSLEAQKIQTIFEEIIYKEKLFESSAKASFLEKLKNFDSLPSKIKDTILDATNKFQDFKLLIDNNNNYIISMTKPGNVIGSKAIYYKKINPEGTTIEMFKDTFDNSGKFVHRKFK